MNDGDVRMTEEQIIKIKKEIEFNLKMLQETYGLDNLILIAGKTPKGTANTIMICEEMGSCYANEQMMEDRLVKMQVSTINLSKDGELT